VLQRVFKTGLTVQPFNELHQTALHVDMFRGEFQSGEFRKFPGFNPRDIMVEGSGFLQWLSVYALAVSSEINVLLLDEPDAHLHPTLQSHLLERLKALSVENSKQALLATHSTEILRQVDHRLIFEVNSRRNGYLTQSEQRVGLFFGLGSEYAPRLDQLRQYRRVVFIEGSFEEPILRTLAERLGQPLPANLVFWIYNGEHPQRRIIFEQLRLEIPNLEGVSIRDRDSLELAEVNANLTEHNHPDRNGLRLRTWRRRQLDNYLLLPAAISRASTKTEVEITEFLANVWGLAVGDNPTTSNCAPGLLDARGKEILTEGLPARNTEPAKPSIETTFGCTRHQIAGHFEPTEVPDDVQTVLREIQQMCQAPVPPP
jgi:energy-coupling factor transporter ATP-binding protein EcfA2